MAATRQLESFFQKFRPLTYKKDETILRAEDTPSGVFYLKEGYARQFSISEEGKDLSLIIFRPGDFFPLRWAIGNTASNYHIEAMTDVEVFRAPRQKFQKFVKDIPEVLFMLTTRILERLGGLLTRMESFVFGNAYAKVALIILICAERFGKKFKGNIVIQIPLHHHDIASLIGVARETASVEMKKLQREGFIEYRGRLIVVKNIQKLRERTLVTS